MAEGQFHSLAHDMVQYVNNFGMMSTKEGIMGKESLVTFVLSELFPGQISVLEQGVRVLYKVIQKLASYPLEPAEDDPPIDLKMFTRGLRWLSQRDNLVSTYESTGFLSLGPYTHEPSVITRPANTLSDYLRMLFRSLATVTDAALESDSNQFDFVPVPQYTMGTIHVNESEPALQDWLEREVMIYRLEDERTIDVLDALNYLMPAIKDQRVMPPPRFCYDQVLPLLPTFKYHLRQLSISYDDIFAFTKLVLALDQVRFSTSEDVRLEAVRLCSYFQVTNGMISWDSFSSAILEDLVSDSAAQILYLWGFLILLTVLQPEMFTNLLYMFELFCPRLDDSEDEDDDEEDDDSDED
jgi:hypothetical protein